MKGILKNTTVLLAITLVAVTALAFVYELTKEPIARAEQQAKAEAYGAVYAQAASFDTVEGAAGRLSAFNASRTDGSSVEECLAACDANGNVLGYVLTAASSKGYGGEIKLLVAVTPDEHVIDFKILAHNETPGLGDNAGKEPFRAKIRGKDAAHLIVTKDQGNTDDVQAMTGATISSRAVTRGVKSAVAAVSSYLADGGR